MAGNKAIYDTAMKRAHEYAWQNQWDRAMKEYARALAEVPNDHTAQRNMAQCLFRLKQWPQALTAYQALLKIDPSDLFTLNRLAEIYLALGQQELAVTTYMRLADLYVQQNQLHEAIRALRDLSRALPMNRDVHNRILQLTQDVGDKQAQLAEHLALSKIALDAEKLSEAQQHADAAASLEPDNPEVKRWNYTVRRRIAEAASTINLQANAQPANSIAGMIGTGLFPTMEQEPPETVTLIEKATEAQERGDFRVALDLYDQAIRAGTRRGLVFYSAGLLNQQLGRPAVAIPFLERATQDPEFATSANYVLGQCYFALDNYPKAVAAFEKSLSLIDTGQLTRNEADELIELYTATAEANLADNNPGRAASLYTNLANMFRDRHWSHPQIALLEKKAEELYNTTIESKLQGISRGSGMLNPAAVRNDGPTSAISSEIGTSTISPEMESSTSNLPERTSGLDERTFTFSSEPSTSVFSSGIRTAAITQGATSGFGTSGMASRTPTQATSFGAGLSSFLNTPAEAINPEAPTAAMSLGESPSLPTSAMTNFTTDSRLQSRTTGPTGSRSSGSLAEPPNPSGPLSMGARNPHGRAPTTRNPQPADGTIEATRIMLEAEGTNALAGGTITLPDARSKPPASADMPTTLMRRLGSNLRTITEFLRAADVATGGEGMSGAGAGAVTGPLSTASADIPASSENPIHIEQHTQTSLSTSALVSLEQQSMAVQLMIAEGEKAMAEGKWDGAIDACMAVIEMDPSYLPVHMMLSDIYVAQGRGEEAATKMQTLMDTYIARKEPAQAAEACSRLLELQPDNPALQSRLGLLLMEAGRVDDAAKALLAVPERLYRTGNARGALEEALKLKAHLPGSSDVALAVGTYQMAVGQTQEALVELGRALQLGPGNNSALARLYVILASTNDPTEWDALDSILERSAKDKATTRLFMEELHRFALASKSKAVPPMYYALALIADKAGLSDIAADALDNGLVQFATTPTTELHESWVLIEVLMCQFRGDLAMTLKDTAVAAQHYSRALQILESQCPLEQLLPSEGSDSPSSLPESLRSPRPQYSFLRVPDPAQLYYGLAEAYSAEDNLEGTLHALHALKKLMPGDHSVHTRLADIYFRQGQLSQALSEFNDLLVQYQRVNDHEKTLETLNNMARLAPNNIAVRRKLADMYIKLGMTDYGLSEMATLAELQLKAGKMKDAISTYQRSADLHYTLGQHDAAITICERIVRIAPRDIDARQQLINMYIQSGKVAEAIASERAMADVFVEEGQVDGAIAALHQLLALAPEDIPAHHMLAQQLISIGEYGQAARLYGRLERLEPENSRNAILHTEMQRMAKEAALAAS